MRLKPSCASFLHIRRTSKSVRIQLAGILKAIVSMRLVRAAKGRGRVPAVEIMVSTGLIRDCIINEDKTSQIREAIAAGTSQYGMQTFDQSLFNLHQSGLITIEEAARREQPDEFRLRMSGIHSAADQAKEDMNRIVSSITSPEPRPSRNTLRTEAASKHFLSHRSNQVWKRKQAAVRRI
jgi:twitching motility protein PilT